MYLKELGITEGDLSPEPVFPLDRVDVGRRTQIINFSQVESIPGPMPANACVEVHTSDGSLGTLTHLFIWTDTQAFAEDLRALVGQDNVPTILCGGDSYSKASENLMLGLKIHLPKNGFLVVNEDLRGFHGRQTRLYRDRVEVQYRGLPPQEPKVLKFAS